jgi:hypothetical protein
VSEVSGRVWVDPEGVSSLGDRYADHAATYDEHLRRLQALRVQYKDAWGDDDMGKEFSQKFLSGLDNLENLVGGVKGTLEYTSEGLRSSGKSYREADDDAHAAGYKMAHDFANFTTTGGGGSDSSEPLSARTPSVPNREPAESPPGKLEPKTLLKPLSGTPLEPATEALHPTAGTPLEPRTEALLQPTEGTLLKPRNEALLKPTAGTPLEPRTETLLPTTSSFVAATPAISSYVEQPEFRTALVGGQPVPEGFRLQALNPMPDGTTHVDANLYDAVSPVVYTPVTAADGSSIDPGDRQFFLVKDNPHADPTANGYRPMYVSYTADGRATPL